MTRQLCTGWYSHTTGRSLLYTRLQKSWSENKFAFWTLYINCRHGDIHPPPLSSYPLNYPTIVSPVAFPALLNPPPPPVCHPQPLWTTPIFVFYDALVGDRVLEEEGNNYVFWGEGRIAVAVYVTAKLAVTILRI